MNEATTTVERRIFQALCAICLIGFPSILLLIDVTNIHPSLGRGMATDQIRQLAASAGEWAQVHGLFVVAGFFGLATMLILRSVIAAKDPSLAPDVAAAVGVVGAVVFLGTVLMEVLVVPELTKACVASGPCLSAANLDFTEALADQGWRALPGLGWGSRGVSLGLLLLAVVGAKSGGLKLWEAAALMVGGLQEFLVGTGLHGWGTFDPELGLTGLTGVAILVANAGVAIRIFRGGKAGAPPETELQAPPQLEGTTAGS